MNTPKHTPGPWLRDGNFVYALTEYTGWGRVKGHVNRFDFSINRGHNITDEEMEANVELNIAAPSVVGRRPPLGSLFRDSSVSEQHRSRS